MGAGEVKGVQNGWTAWLVALELLSLEELHMAHEFVQRARGPECSTFLTFFDRTRVGLQITKNTASVRRSELLLELRVVDLLPISLQGELHTLTAYVAHDLRFL